jgi:hypothetical protein
MRVPRLVPSCTDTTARAPPRCPLRHFNRPNGVLFGLAEAGAVQDCPPKADKQCMKGSALVYEPLNRTADLGLSP